MNSCLNPVTQNRYEILRFDSQDSTYISCVSDSDSVSDDQSVLSHIELLDDAASSLKKSAKRVVAAIRDTELSDMRCAVEGTAYLSEGETLESKAWLYAYFVALINMLLYVIFYNRVSMGEVPRKEGGGDERAERAEGIAGVEGVEGVRGRRVLLAPNHLANIDALALMTQVPGQTIHFLGKASFLSNPLIKPIVRPMGQIPLDRSGGRNSLVGLSRAVEIMSLGGLVAMFPEGGRSPDGRLYRFRTGAIRVALAAGGDIVPVGIKNTPGLFRPGEARVFNFGQPINVTALAESMLVKHPQWLSDLQEGGDKAHKAQSDLYRELAGVVRHSVQNMTGQTLASETVAEARLRLGA